MATSKYLVTTTLGPQYLVVQAEYENLVDLGLVQSVDHVYPAAEDIVLSPTAPTTPPAGTVWVNTTVA